MGPKKGDSSWNKPVEKLRTRTGLWQDLPAGLFWNSRIYNVFLLPILMFVAQLERLPKFAEDAAVEAMFKMAKGPGNWCCKEDLWSLRENYGQTGSFRCLAWACQAAKIRVVLKKQGISNLEEFLSDYDTIEKHWRESKLTGSQFYSEWKNRSFIVTLKENKELLEKSIGSEERVRRTLPQGKRQQDNDKTWHKEVERTYYKCIQAFHLGDPVSRIRKKLERYALDDARLHLDIPGSTRQRTPAWQAIRAHCNLRSLRKISPPRLQGAVFSTLWNRWTTERRMHQTRYGRCLICRKEGTADSIEHYTKCAFTQRLYATKLNLDPAVFANMHAWTLCSPHIVTEEQLLGVGIAIYAVYNTTNRLRHNARAHSLNEEDRFQMLAQSIKEAVKGHEQASWTLVQRWNRNRENTPLTFDHNIWEPEILCKIKSVRNQRKRCPQMVLDENGSVLEEESLRKRRRSNNIHNAANSGNDSNTRSENSREDRITARFIGGNWLSIAGIH